MGLIYFLVKNMSIAKIINISLFVIYFAIKLQEVFLLSKQVIRKTHRYQIQTITLHNEFKITYSNFSNLIDDLVINLKKYIRYMVEKTTNSINSTNPILHKDTFDIESIFYKISKMTLQTDEIIQNIGGLEFSTPAIINQFTNVLRLIEIQYNHVVALYTRINENIKSSNYILDQGLDLKNDVLQLELEFSILQEEIQDSLPQVILLFDELNKYELNALKYNGTSHF